MGTLLGDLPAAQSSAQKLFVRELLKQGEIWVVNNSI